MKKIKVVQILGIVLFIIYIVFIILNTISSEFLKEKNNLIFSAILAILSLTLIYKGALLKSSSTLWFSLNLISYAIIIVIFQFLNINLYDNYYILSCIPIIVSLINLAVFGYLIYIKVIIINLSILPPIIAWQFGSINIGWVVGIAVVSLIIGILICRSIYFKREKF